MKSHSEKKEDELILNQLLEKRGQIKSGNSIFSICVTKAGMKFKTAKGTFVLTEMKFDSSGALTHWEYAEIKELKTIKAVDLEKAIDDKKIEVL